MNFSVGPVSESISSWLAAKGLPQFPSEVVAILFVCALPVLGIVFPIAGVAQYFERKIAGGVQRRKGPMVGAGGIVDLVCDLALIWQPKWKRRAFARKIERAPLIGSLDIVLPEVDR